MIILVTNQLLKYIKNLYKSYQSNVLSDQDVLNKLHAKKSIALSIHMNIDNYLYRNGIFNKATAIKSAKDNINKFKLFANRKAKFQTELKQIKQSNQHWFENYGSHDSPYHDLIKLSIDRWKMNGLLSSLICDLYVGTVNEGSTEDLMFK